MEKSVCFQVLKMNNQLVIWVGLESEPVFKELALAMTTTYQKSPTSTKLMGDVSSVTSCTLASRISQRCNKPVFVSFNIPDSNEDLFMKIEERLAEEMAVAPEFF